MSLLCNLVGPGCLPLSNALPAVVWADMPPCVDLVAFVCFISLYARIRKPRGVFEGGEQQMTPFFKREI